MKVLFAVNDENISTSIVKKYQKQYKEIISYKNVYYFNAILKELQRNKSYDRVVISEELEEFTSSSYEQKDKFIFDRLDNISDEAVAADGSDIPIILICSERRNKSEEILVKLFGIGIYNAIIGEDRSTEEVCRLINKPRSKKEAKLYYKIDSENVTYEKEKESDVNEIELQNILRHFKRLGSNTEKYAESFKNIVSQYNQAQLKVIIAVLPNEVKEVLDETSAEYQKIVYPEGKTVEPEKKEVKNSKTKPQKTKGVKKATTEKLLQTDATQVMSKPVVVPTTIEKSLYKKVNPKKQIEIDIDELEDDDDDMYNIENIIEKTPKKRGRPKKNVVQEEQKQESEKNKKRGRPRKNQIQEEQIDILPGFEEDEEEKEYELHQNKNVAKRQLEEQEEIIMPGLDSEEEINDNNYNDEYEEEQDKYEEDKYEEDEYDDEYDEDKNEYDEDEYDDEYEEEQDEYEEDIDNNDEIYETKSNRYKTSKKVNTPQKVQYRENSKEIEEYDNVFKDGEIESLLTGDKKVTTFVGTSKNGTSFLVNNVAQILSSMGINTAILDATQNKNSYYIYTKNDEELRNIAAESIKNLINGIAQGIRVNNNLTVYTGIPNQKEEINNSRPIMETLLKNHSLILIDCDFNTPIEYFDKSQELYLVQSMDVLTIQPLTEFLRDLQIKNILDQSKIRIVLNKLLKIRRVNGNTIIGGMSKYNNPDLSLMKDLFNAKTVKIAAQIPFDEDVYAKYLEGLIECEIKLNGYPKDFRARLNSLADTIYPLLPNKNTNKKSKKQEYNQYSNSFSTDMNSTLDNMRKRY